MDWENRKDNLESIRIQLQNPKIEIILNILKESNSSYLKNFENLIG